MTQKVKAYIENGEYVQARILADRLFQAGENSVEFWILNATLYEIENNAEAEYACISRGIQIGPANYELYYMLGNYYLNRNIDQAYLCYEQAEYYGSNSEDEEFLRHEREKLEAETNVNPVSIVILSYNIKDILKACIQSIRDTMPKRAYEIVVVDNASSDGAAEWLREQNDIVLRCNTENSGFALGCNQGIELSADNNDILLLNNDTIIPQNAMFWLRMGLYSRKSVGATGPITSSAVNDQQLSNKLGSVEEYLKLSREICIPTPAPYENKLWLVGFAMLIKNEALKKVGVLDTRYGWGNFEDDDYGMMLTEAGYELLLCYNSFIFHYGSMNMSKDREKYIKYISRNYKLLIDKWQMDVPYQSMAHREQYLAIDEPGRKSFKVLEINCGCGATLARIKYLNPGAEVYGIEKDEKLAAFGKYMADIRVCDIEKEELPFEHKTFEYILINNIQGVTRNLDMIYEKAVPYVKDTGKILVADIEYETFEDWMKREGAKWDL